MELANAGRKNLATHVYEAVRAAIASGELTPGSLYSVNTIAARLSVSRTPAREALLKLEDQGMVRFERNKGARILETSVHDLIELFSLRILLDTASAYRATQNANAADIVSPYAHCTLPWMPSSARWHAHGNYASVSAF